MNIAESNEPRIVSRRVTSKEVIARLADGRTVAVPLAWSWRLSEATPEQRNRFEIMGSGQGVNWPDIDEDISAIGMLCGSPARRLTRVKQAQPDRSASRQATPD